MKQRFNVILSSQSIPSIYYIYLHQYICMTHSPNPNIINKVDDSIGPWGKICRIKYRLQMEIQKEIRVCLEKKKKNWFKVLTRRKKMKWCLKKCPIIFVLTFTQSHGELDQAMCPRNSYKATWYTMFSFFVHSDDD